MIGLSGLLAAAEPFSGNGISTRAHVVIAVVTLVGLVFVIRMLRRHRLKSKYTMLWMFSSMVLVVLVIFPSLLSRVSRAVGIYYPPATFLAVACGVLFLVAVQFSWELSRLEERTRTLAEEAALLGRRVELLEERVAEADADDHSAS